MLGEASPLKGCRQAKEPQKKKKVLTSRAKRDDAGCRGAKKSKKKVLSSKQGCCTSAEKVLTSELLPFQHTLHFTIVLGVH